MAGYITFLPYLKKQSNLPSPDGRETTITIDVIDDKGASETLPPHVLKIRGAEDILGINPKIVARHEPKPNTPDFECNNFPFIEFADPDFLWRYTPAVAGTMSNMKPWLALVVISEDEIALLKSEGIDAVTRIRDRNFALTVKTSLLPPSGMIDLAAHAQFNEFNGNINDHIANNPAGSYCRLMCLRKLEPSKTYHAYVVPAFKSSVNSAFGLETINFTEQAWDSSKTDEVVKLPIYYQYRFTTAEFGDFEYFARKLETVKATPDLIGTRVVDANQMQTGQRDTNLKFFREGVAVAPCFESTRESFYDVSERLPLTEPLRDLLNESIRTDPVASASEDPLITFPVYGMYFRKVTEFKLPANGQSFDDPCWMQELNLDFRNRVMAAFGTRTVTVGKDKYLKAAWQQAGELKEANEEIRKSRAAMLIARQMRDKHFNSLTKERFIQVTSPVHDRLALKDTGSSVTVKAALQESGVVPGSFSVSFRKAASFKTPKADDKLLAVWDREEKSKTLPTVVTAEKDPEDVSPLFLKMFKDKKTAAKVTTRVKAQAGELVPMKKIDITHDVRPKVNMDSAIRDRLKGIIKINRNDVSLSEELDPLLAAIHIDDPMYEGLRDQSPDYFIPGLENLGNNGVTMLMENRRMIESYMVSCNYQLMRTALFNSLFIDKRSTIFKYFWDPTGLTTKPDVENIHAWKNDLGSNKPTSKGSSLIFCIKGDLIRRYPDTIIYTRKLNTYMSALNETAQSNIADTEIIEPIFRARVSEDILCVGFPYSLEDTQGTNKQYYIILQEHNDLPRFGLDVGTRATRQKLTGTAGDTTTTRSENPLNKLGWINVDVNANGYISDFKSPLFSSTNPNVLNSSTIANACYQMPVRVAIHISKMLLIPECNGR